MPSWWDRLRPTGPAEPEPLKGQRPVRRLKIYSSMTGYVYEYAYEGYRDAGGEREHVFSVSADRKNWFLLPVLVPDEALTDWEREHERGLNEAERYAVAKLALFAAFDERPTPAALCAPVQVDAGQVTLLLDSIDL